MKTANSPFAWAQPKAKPPALAASKLSSIKVKDYSLIGFRDQEAELEISNHLEILKSKFGFRAPRLYTLVSQNRKISTSEILSNSSRFFLNFESCKWSELFYGFFRQIVNPDTETFIFRHLLYSLDTYVCQFQLLAAAIKNSSTELNSALHRHQNQIELLSTLQNHPHADKLALLFIFELLLISLGKNHLAATSAFITKTESQILLSYFSSHRLIGIKIDKLFYSAGQLHHALKKYFEFRGQILFTENSKNIFCEKVLLSFENIFEEKETVLEHGTFETCFTHF